MQNLTRTQRYVRMVKMQGAEDEGAGSVLKYMTKPEDDSNAADWLLRHTAADNFFALFLKKSCKIIWRVQTNAVLLHIEVVAMITSEIV